MESGGLGGNKEWVWPVWVDSVGGKTRSDESRFTQSVFFFFFSILVLSLVWVLHDLLFFFFFFFLFFWRCFVFFFIWVLRHLMVWFSIPLLVERERER
jgi:hypothetical protein